MPELLKEPDDMCLFMTEKCNSNCVMCPMSIHSRMRGLTVNEDRIESILEQIPENTTHLTITGGEPFLRYEQVIHCLEYINRRFPCVDVLILTNGRALAIRRIFDKVRPFITEKIRFAIPIHASTPELHDLITQAPGSFAETLCGLENLSGTLAQIEIRIVGHRLNIHNIGSTYEMLSNFGGRIDVIHLIAMEMTGCAARNRDRLWVDYGELVLAAEEGIHYAMMHGIDTGLYNFPLCTIPQRLWSLARNSITASKVRYYETCGECDVFQICGGLFYSTFELNLCPVCPIHDNRLSGESGRG